MKTVTSFVLAFVVTCAYAGHYGPVYTPVIKAEYPSYAVHSPLIAAPGFGESLIKKIEVAPVIKTIAYEPAFGHLHYPTAYDYGQGPWD